MLIEFIVLFAVFYMWHAIGITVGYHRLISHRSFSCPKWVEYLLVLPGYLAFEGSPTFWASIHRAHHRHTDTDLDPHSPRNGLWTAHSGWLANRTYPAHINPNTQAKDMVNDPVYAFLEQKGDWLHGFIVLMVFCIGFRLLLWACFGWVAAAASLAAGLFVMQIPFFLNVICHLPKLGYKTFAVHDDSVNIWWVAAFTLGEGWHNNHHAIPGSARSGLLPWEIDATWLIIAFLKKIGLVTRVNEATREEAERRKERLLFEKNQRLLGETREFACPVQTR